VCTKAATIGTQQPSKHKPSDALMHNSELNIWRFVSFKPFDVEKVANISCQVAPTTSGDTP